MKYITHLLTDDEYRQKATEYTQKHFIKKNRILVDLHQKGEPITNKNIANVWSELKEIIWKKQGMRCCICERDLDITHSADVEHYRPKNEYWWLAYDYKNYYLACAECNRKYKHTKFPLFDEDKRVDYTSRKNIGKEQPLLINPLFDKPLDYFRIHFRSAPNSMHNIITLIPKDKASPNYNYQKAKKSIEIYNLDLSTPDGFRHETLRKFFNKLIKVAVYRDVFKREPKEFRKFFKDFIKEEDRKDLSSLGLMKMVTKGQFIIDPYILNLYRRRYRI